MEQSEHFATHLGDLSDVLDPLGIRWSVVGAVAANFYRDQIRTTSDLDVLISLSGQSVGALADLLCRHSWQSVEVITDSLLRAEHTIAGRLDILISKTDYEEGAISRALKENLDKNHAYRTLAIEDMLIHHLLADRYQDKADVVSVLIRRPELDWNYMSKWLKEFELEQRLEQIEAHALKKGQLSEPILRRPKRKTSQ